MADDEETFFTRIASPSASSMSTPLPEEKDHGYEDKEAHRISILLDDFEPVPISKHRQSYGGQSGNDTGLQRGYFRSFQAGIIQGVRKKGYGLLKSSTSLHFLLWVIGMAIVVVSTIVLTSKSNPILPYAYDFELDPQELVTLNGSVMLEGRTESIRWGFYFIFLVGLYVLVAESLKLIPFILQLWYTRILKRTTIPHSVNDNLAYYKSLKPYFLFFAVALGAMVMGARVFPFDAKTSSPGNGMQGDWWKKDWKFYWRRSLTAIWVASLFLLIKKWIIQQIKYMFHMVHYDDLAQRNNLCLEIALRLRTFSKEIQEVDASVMSDYPDNLSMDSLLNECFDSAIALPSGKRPPLSQKDDSHKEQDHYGHDTETVMGIKKESITLALNVRKAVLSARHQQGTRTTTNASGASSDALKPEDFKVIFPQGNDASIVFKLMDRDGNGDLTIQELVWFIANTFIQRQGLLDAMSKGDTIIKKLERILEFAMSILLITILFTVYDLPTSSLATVGTFFVGLGFVFGTSASNLLQSIIFVFVIHPYDVGDQIYLVSRGYSRIAGIGDDVDLNRMIVFDIGLLSTTFLQPTGRLLYIANHVLAAMDIENVKRAAQQSEIVCLELPIFTPMDSVLQLKQLVEEYIKGESRDFSLPRDLFTIRLLDPKRFQLVIRLQYAKGIQVSGFDLRWQKRTQFHEFLIECCQNLSIEGK